MTREESIAKAQQAFGELIRQDYQRIDGMKKAQEPLDFSKLNKIIVGILPGDGIGPVIMPLALKVMEALVGDEIKSGKIEIRHIEGMTIENRVAKLNSLPEECLEEIKQCQEAIDTVLKAMEETGVKPKVEPIRGGTDGAQLSYRGLPCPNIFAGGVNFHGPYEFVSIQVMEKAMQVVVKICELTAQYND